MIRSSTFDRSHSLRDILRLGGLVVAAAACGLGCTVGASTAAGSAYTKGSLYRSASALVGLAPDQAFNPAVEVLLERGDIEITDLEEADNRCRAVVGDRKITFKVVASGAGLARLSMVVGGGDDPGVNQELADTLMRGICSRLPVACENHLSTN